MKYKLIIFALFGIVMTLTYIVVTTKPKEGFESEAEEITKVITLLNDALCPVYKIILDDLKTDSTAEAAHAILEKAAGGRLFPCPPPADPVQLSSTIDLDLQRTINYYDTKIQTMLETTTNALTACATAATEGFEDVCPQTTSPPQPPKQKACIDPSSLSSEDREAILKQRYISLAKVLSQEENSKKIARIKKNTNELLNLKQKAERGELQPAC